MTKLKLTKDVQEQVDVLINDYELDPELCEFHIFHMYPSGEQAYPNGYIDSQFFSLVGFNTELMKYRDLGEHDSMDFDPSIADLKMIRIFADGSTMIKFRGVVEIWSVTQAITIYPRGYKAAFERTHGPW